MTELKGRMDKFHNYSGEIPFSVMHRRQEISKDIENLDNTIKQLDLIDILGKLHQITFFLMNIAHRTFTKMDYVLYHQINLNKLKNIYIQSIFSAHNRIKLEVNNRNISGYITNYMETKQHTSK